MRCETLEILLYHLLLVLILAHCTDWG